MKLLLDECIPKSLKRALLPLNSITVYEMGWGGTKDKELLSLAKTHFDVFVTIDQNMTYQQHLAEHVSLHIIVLKVPNNRPETIAAMAEPIKKAVTSTSATITSLQYPA
jgi:predicted nuclease of predicted toxin-antitoxin system